MATQPLIGRDILKISSLKPLNRIQRNMKGCKYLVLNILHHVCVFHVDHYMYMYQHLFHPKRGTQECDCGSFGLMLLF